MFLYSYLTLPLVHMKQEICMSPILFCDPGWSVKFMQSTVNLINLYTDCQWPLIASVYSIDRVELTGTSQYLPFPWNYWRTISVNQLYQLFCLSFYFAYQWLWYIALILKRRYIQDSKIAKPLVLLVKILLSLPLSYIIWKSSTMTLTSTSVWLIFSTSSVTPMTFQKIIL